MSDNLTALEQKDVTFYDDELIAIRANDGHIYVALRQMCEALGVDAQAQRRRIERSGVLEDGLQRVAILTTHRGRQVAYVLRNDLVPLWLSGIRSKSVREDVRPKLEQFQRKAAKVLADAFMLDEVTHRPVDDNLQEILNSDNPLAVAYRHGMAIANLAREQLLLRQQFDTRMSSAETRLDAIEAELGNPDRFITTSQIGDLLDAIRAVAVQLTKLTGANSFGSTHGEFHRRFSINSYKKLPAAKFDDAMIWLRNWYEDLTDGDAAPF